MEDTEVILCRIPELPTAREAMSKQEAYVKAQEAQMKQFIDNTGGIWLRGT